MSSSPSTALVAIGTMVKQLPPDPFLEGLGSVRPVAYDLKQDDTLCQRFAKMPETPLWQRSQEIKKRTGKPPLLPGKYAIVALSVQETIRRLGRLSNRNRVPLEILYEVLHELQMGILILPLYVATMTSASSKDSTVVDPDAENQLTFFGMSNDCIFSIRNLCVQQLLDGLKSAQSVLPPHMTSSSFVPYAK